MSGKQMQPVILGEIEEWTRTLLEFNDPRITNSSAISFWNQDKYSGRNNQPRRKRLPTDPTALSSPRSSTRFSTRNQMHSGSKMVISPPDISLTSRSRTIVASPEDRSNGEWKVPSSLSFQPWCAQPQIIPDDTPASSLPTCLNSSPDLSTINSPTTLPAQDPSWVSFIPSELFGSTRANTLLTSLSQWKTFITWQSTGGIINLTDDLDFDIPGNQNINSNIWKDNHIFRNISTNTSAKNNELPTPSIMISSSISKSHSLLSSLNNQLNLIKYQLIDKSDPGFNQQNVDIDRSIRTVYELSRLVDDIRYFNELNHFNESIFPIRRSSAADTWRKKSPFHEGQIPRFDEPQIEQADDGANVLINQPNFDFDQGVGEGSGLDGSSVETIISSSPVDVTSVSQSIPPPSSRRKGKKQNTLIQNEADESSHANDNADVSRKRRRLYLPRSDQWLETNSTE